MQIEKKTSLERRLRGGRPLKYPFESENVFEFQLRLTWTSHYDQRRYEESDQHSIRIDSEHLRFN